MITKKTALKEAGRFAAALDGPLGRRPMQRVIAEFLPLFHALRSSDASWGQIAALLAAAGVRSRSGQPLGDGVLRAMVSRAEREPGVPNKSGGGTAGEHVRRVAVNRREAAETSFQPGPGNMLLQRTDAALPDVAERIRRASALRGAGSSADRG